MFRTRLGDRVLKQLRTEHSALKMQTARAEHLGPADLALATGLFGFGILNHEPLSPLHSAIAPPSAGGHGCGGGSGCGLVTRHGFAARVAMLREARRGVLAVRLPYFGERWLSLPFTWRSSSWVALNACSGRRGPMSGGDKEAERAGDVEVEPNAIIG